MASHNDLSFEWSLLCNECDLISESDLQLAAELGKTLLERNKELEGAIKQQQIAIDDQSQEIEYLTKQNNALREVNDTRLKIYENIEISIQDLEKQNHRLNVENNNFKKSQKAAAATVEALEEKCDEVRRQVDELNRELEIERRKNERLQHEQRTRKEEAITATIHTNSRQPDPNKNMASTIQPTPYVNVRSEMNDSEPMMGIDEVDRQLAATCDSEELENILTELDGTKRQLNSERQRVSELEDQLSSLVQDNRELQNRIAQNTSSEMSEMRSMHDELSFLEESGQSRMCRRCLNALDDDNLTVPDYASSIACTEDGDDASLNELLPSRTSSVQNIFSTPTHAANQDVSSADSTLELDAPSPNPYRDLVEKYEALISIHTESFNNAAFSRNRSDEVTPTSSLHDEPVCNNLNAITASSTPCDSNTAQMDKENIAPRKTGATRKLTLRTPTDFSEAETASSGYSDEISNKFTQTDETFLCTIADGDDKFTIYDEASPIDSRFRHCPKYRHLFKEIFATLKKAAENKDDGEKLPLLDDANPAFKVPPVTPATEELPNFPDETESVVSSVVSEQSVAMSECVTKHERKTAKKKTGQEPKQQTKKELYENCRMISPGKRENLEYLAMTNSRKKNKKRPRQTPMDPSDGQAIIPSSPRFFYAGRKNRERREYHFEDRAAAASTSTTNKTETSPNSKDPQSEVYWRGNSITVYNRNMRAPKIDPVTGETIVYRTKSAAAHDLHKLMKLDLSYAEVLRHADQSNKHHHHHRRRK